MLEIVNLWRYMYLLFRQRMGKYTFRYEAAKLWNMLQNKYLRYHGFEVF